MAYCRKCGAEIDEDVKFCPECGTGQETVVMQESIPQGPIKAPTGRMVAMWIFCALGGWIGIILAVSIISSKNPDKTHKYIDSSRNQAIVGLIISILWIIIYFALL